MDEDSQLEAGNVAPIRRPHGVVLDNQYVRALPRYSQDLDLNLQDLEAVRLVLRGGSVVDWHRLNFETREQALNFVRVNGFDPTDPRDEETIEHARLMAIDYLQRNFKWSLSERVRTTTDVCDLILLASTPGGWSRDQILACVLLKTMHIVQHIQGHHLLQEVALPETQLFDELDERIRVFSRSIGDLGLPIVHFFGSRKTNDSVITKLFLKRRATAAMVMDRMRYRIVTEDRSSLPYVLAYLLRHLLPFNQCRADQSSNNLIDFRAWLEESPELRPFSDRVQLDIGMEEDEGMGTWPNRFSSSGYRMINFVIALPVRLDHMSFLRGHRCFESCGPVVHVSTEFQLVDRESAYLNEQGPNSHAAYKRRQRKGVEQRLRWGKARQRLQVIRDREEKKL